MTNIEIGRLAELEGRIERGLTTFVDVGSALLEIRESRLYRREFGAFEDYCRERWGMVRQQANRLIAAAQTLEILEPMGSILPSNERQARPLTALPPAQQAQAWEMAVESARGEQPTAAQVKAAVDEVKGKPRPENIHVSDDSNEWYTPSEYVEMARRVLGEIDLDPASSHAAQKTVKAKAYLTAEDNGLVHEWRGRVFINPPYSYPLIEQFVEKLIDHVKAGDVPMAIVVTNNSTDTAWFHALADVSAAIGFTRGRMKFYGPDTPQATGARQGQAVFFIGGGGRVEKFARAFSDFGMVLRK